MVLAKRFTSGFWLRSSASWPSVISFMLPVAASDTNCCDVSGAVVVEDDVVGGVVIGSAAKASAATAVTPDAQRHFFR